MAKLMMTAIPPFSRNEITTKTGLAQFATRDEMHAEFAAIQLEIANRRIQILAQFRKLQRNLLFQIATLNILTAGNVIAAVHYLR